MAAPRHRHPSCLSTTGMASRSITMLSTSATRARLTLRSLPIEGVRTALQYCRTLGCSSGSLALFHITLYLAAERPAADRTRPSAVADVRSPPVPAIARCSQHDSTFISFWRDRVGNRLQHHPAMHPVLCRPALESSPRPRTRAGSLRIVALLCLLSIPEWFYSGLCRWSKLEIELGQFC